MKHVGQGLVLDMVRLREFCATDTHMTSTFIHSLETTPYLSLQWQFKLSDNINNLMNFTHITTHNDFLINVNINH